MLITTPEEPQERLSASTDAVPATAEPSCLSFDHIALRIAGLTDRAAAKTAARRRLPAETTRATRRTFEALLAGINWKDGYLTHRQTTLAAQAGLSRRTVLRSLDTLECRGVICRKRRARVGHAITIPALLADYQMSPVKLENVTYGTTKMSPMMSDIESKSVNDFHELTCTPDGPNHRVFNHSINQEYKQGGILLTTARASSVTHPSVDLMDLGERGIGWVADVFGLVATSLEAKEKIRSTIIKSMAQWPARSQDSALRRRYAGFAQWFTGEWLPGLLSDLDAIGRDLARFTGDPATVHYGPQRPGGARSWSVTTATINNWLDSADEMLGERAATKADWASLRDSSPSSPPSPTEIAVAIARRLRGARADTVSDQEKAAWHAALDGNYPADDIRDVISWLVYDAQNPKRQGRFRGAFHNRLNDRAWPERSLALLRSALDALAVARAQHENDWQVGLSFTIARTLIQKIRWPKDSRGADIIIKNGLAAALGMVDPDRTHEAEVRAATILSGWLGHTVEACHAQHVRPPFEWKDEFPQPGASLSPPWRSSFDQQFDEAVLFMRALATLRGTDQSPVVDMSELIKSEQEAREFWAKWTADRSDGSKVLTEADIRAALAERRQKPRAATA